MSSQLWWDPMTKIDTKFLQLGALMNPNSISGYPISSGNMKALIDQTINENNIAAAIGAFILWTSKQQATINRENFKTIHLAWLDRCLFMLTSKDLKSEMENYLYWQFRLVIQNWCKIIDKKILKSTEKQLQEAIGYMETGFKENQKNRQIHQKIIKGILKVLHVQMNNKDTQEDFGYFQNKFTEHVKCILFHKRSIVFCAAIYEIFFTVIQSIYPIENGYNSNNSIGFIEKQLFFLLNQQRLSISIEHMGFLLRKILKLIQKIPQKTLAEIMRLVYITIDRYQVVRINLVQKVQFFNFHMKKHNYFYYLEEIQKIKKYGQQDIINEWKMKIRNSIQMQQRDIKPTKDDIDQAIFFIQLRQKSKYLYDIHPRGDIWEFPDIQSKVVKRVMTTLHNKFLEFNGSGTRVGQYFTKRIKLNTQYALRQYRELNLLQKGVYVYYLHHHYISSLLVKHAKPIEQIPTLKIFLSKLEPSQVIELFDFYLIEIQLGNFYNVPFKKNLFMNDIGAYLYRSLATQIVQRILQFLSQQARLVMTKGMVYFLTFIKMYVIFETLLFKNQHQIKICRKCKIIMSSQNNYSCHHCQEILIGLKLNNQNQHYMVWQDQDVNQFQPWHTCTIKQKIKALNKQNRTRMNNKSSEYSSMCNLLFEQALRRLNR